MNTVDIILRYSPEFIRKRVEGRDGLNKILDNINWLTFEKIVRLGIGVIIYSWIARYLGPEKFGILNFVLAFVALFSSFSSLGLANIVVRNLVQNPKNQDKYLGSTFFLRIVGSILMIFFSLLGIMILKPNNMELFYFVLIVGIGTSFKSSETIDYWFQSKIQSKYTVYSKTLSFIIITLLYTILIISQKSLVAFFLVWGFDFFLIAFFSSLFYQIKSPLKINHWKIDLKTISYLLNDSWPLIFSGLANMIFMKIDQVMIGSMINQTALGIYSSAVRVSEAWYFLPVIISGSVFPAILKAKKSSSKLYKTRLQTLFYFFTYFSLFFAIFISFFSKHIIQLLFGSQYLEASIILSIHIWGGIFVFYAVAGSKFLIAENYTKIAMSRVIIATTMNIILNLILIPKIGIIGAAISTVISYSINSVFSNLLFKKSRILFFMIVKSLNPIVFFKLIFK